MKAPRRARFLPGGGPRASPSPAGPPGAGRGACSAQGRPPGGSTTAKRPGCFAAALGGWSGAGGNGGAPPRPESSRSRLRPMNQVRAPTGNPSAQIQTSVLSPLSRLPALPDSPHPHLPTPRRASFPPSFRRLFKPSHGQILQGLQGP